MKKLFTLLFGILTISAFGQISGNSEALTEIAYTYTYTGPMPNNGHIVWSTSTSSSISQDPPNGNPANITFHQSGASVVTAQVFDQFGSPNTLNYNVNVTTGSPSASTLWNENNEGELYFDGNVGIGNTNPAYKLDVTGNARISGDLILKSNPFIDDDTNLGGNSDDWIKLNGFIELKSNTDNYGIVLRDKDNTEYFGITQKNGWSYLTDNSSSGNYFLRGNGANAQVRGTLTTGGTIITTSHGSSANWKAAYDWGDHASSGYYKSGNSPVFGTITLGSTKMNGNANRAGLLEVKKGGSQSWSGISVEHTSTSAWSLMGDQDDFGIYDDYNNEWALIYNENSSIDLYHNGSKKFNTTSSGINVSGNVTASGGNSTNWNTAYTQRGSQIAGTGLTWSGGKLNAILQSASLVITGTNQWNPDGSANPVFQYDDANPTYNGKYHGAIIDIKGDGNQGEALVRSGSYHADHFQASGGFYVGNLETNGTQIIDASGNITTSSLLSSGIVRIGSTTTHSNSPTLFVNGGSYFTDINVEALSAWPDYVFSDDYKLKTLEETEAFINENQHLPEVPSAQEVEENGINVAEMNTILLEKIEELMLHLIEQNKQMKKLADKVEKLENDK